ncbi:hypothetical protein B1R94_28435 [Mycolicibacterium litorale]|nr:hypothetical protein B1R94_28435 [Mycolicibacterium litorale]
MTHPAQTWYSWHAQYDDLESSHTDRLEVVQDFLIRALDAASPGPLKAVSICAGQSRDLLPVLIRHPRGADVSARMVEQDPLNASFMHGALGSTRLKDVEVVVADAGTTDVYTGAVPADLLLLGGVFANITLADASRTVTVLSHMCRPGAMVVWTSYPPRLDDADEVLALFATSSFESVDLHRDEHYLVAAHRYCGPARILPAGQRLFAFGSDEN